MLGDQFSLNSSFPGSYPHGNKHLTKFILQSPPNGKELHFLEGVLLVGDEAQWSSTMALAIRVQLLALFPIDGNKSIDGFEKVGRKKTTHIQITIIIILDITISIDRRTVSNMSVTFQKH